MNCLYCFTSSRSAGGTGLGVATAVAICHGCGAGLCLGHLVSGPEILCLGCSERLSVPSASHEKGSAHVV